MVSPSCIKHLRLLKQFLLSLSAVRKGISPPKYKTEVNFGQMEAEHRMQAGGGIGHRLMQHQQQPNGEDKHPLKYEFNGNDSLNEDEIYGISLALVNNFKLIDD